jgi:hypothetical protein
MARPVGEITVECPGCGRCFTDWTPVVEVDFDPDLGDPGFVSSTAACTCPQCGHQVLIGGPLPPEHESRRCC